jgi:SWI/SNF-related matrix-associated actin-dependent regulator 1 of chromatin subfamily A
VAKTLADEGLDGLKAMGPHVAQLRRLTGLAKVPAAIEWIKEWFEGGGGKLVVFAHHRDVLAALYNAFGDCAAMVTGGTTADVRQAEIDEFQNSPKCKIFIGQIQAAGTGLTLTASSDVLFVESSWVPAENEQAAARIHRIGQRNACTVRFAMLAGSIDEDIQKAVVRKTSDIARLFS